jgi:hypothetical protein
MNLNYEYYIMNWWAQNIYRMLGVHNIFLIQCFLIQSQISSSWSSKMIHNDILYALDWSWQTKHLGTVFGEQLIFFSKCSDSQIHSCLFLLLQPASVWHCLMTILATRMILEIGIADSHLLCDVIAVIL